MIFEEGYGERFDLEDAEIAEQSGGIASRYELLAELGAVILTKPMLADLQELKLGGILWDSVGDQEHVASELRLQPVTPRWWDAGVEDPDGPRQICHHELVLIVVAHLARVGRAVKIEIWSRHRSGAFQAQLL